MDFPPLITPPNDPFDLESQEVFALPRTVGRMVGEGRARDAVTRRALGPADLDRATFAAVEAIWIPLWRIEGSSDTFSIGISRTVETITRWPDVGVLGGGGKRSPSRPRPSHRTRRRTSPIAGYQHREQARSILARRVFPIRPHAHLYIPRSDLVDARELSLDPLDTVLPDMSREQACEAVQYALEVEGRSRGGLLSHVTTRIADAQLVFYPLYVQRYRYGGEAVDGGSRVFYSALSGTTGKVVASEHPSGWKSIVGKLGRLFDRG
ncbi:MAG TPA: hypothetical protein ENK57_19995 [Polyangiaceae bacterium]|nr:hypothetical protein [Polyangiaceae bacterium]